MTVTSNSFTPLPASPEFPHAIDGEENWTEYYYFFGYDHATERGVSIHVGREPFDPEIWRAAVTVYLPGDALLMGKFFGRDGHPRGPAAGPLRISCIVPESLWAVEFDGVLQRTTRSEIAAGTLPDGPNEAVSFGLAFTGAAPMMSFHVEQMEAQSWAKGHWDQICRVNGDITVGGERCAVNGAAVRDHSVGTRDYTPVIGSAWFNCLFEDGTVLTALNTSGGCGRELRKAHLLRAGAEDYEDIAVIDFPEVGEDAPGSLAPDPMDDPACRTFGFSFVDAAGATQRIEAEMVHAAVTSLLPPSDEVMGTASGPGLQLGECPIRVRWGDLIGFGVRERTVRLAVLAGRQA